MATAQHARGSRIRVNGVSLYYEEHGSGAPILCLHGSGSSSALWRDAVERLGTRGRALVLDRRGFGRSERPEPFATDVHQQADDAAALLDALGAAPAIVIGRSQGGEIAVDLALRYADRVRALALLEGGGLALSESMRQWLDELHARIEAAAASDVATVGETIVRGVLGDDAWDELPPLVREVFTANGPAILAEERSGPLAATPEQLATIRQPTLVVGGEESPPAFAEATRLTAAAIPKARLEWVEGGHFIDPAHPVVLAFVEDVLAAG